MSVKKKKRKRKYKQSVPVKAVKQETLQQPADRSDSGSGEPVNRQKEADKKETAESERHFHGGFLLLALFLSCSYIYMEVLFKLSVETLHTWNSFVFLTVFAVCGGLIAAAVNSLFPKKAAYFLTLLNLILVFFIFLIEFLICRQFKMAYDLNTIFNAATDALGGFGDDIKRLIFCFDGISHIILLLIPVIAWIVLGGRITKRLPEKGVFGKERRLIALSFFSLLTGAAAVYGIGLFLIMGCGWNKGLYTNQYNFEMAVSGFGLGEGLGLDAWNMATAKSSGPVFENPGDSLAVMSSQTLDVYGVNNTEESIGLEEIGYTAGTEAALSGTVSADVKDTAVSDNAPEPARPVVYGYSVSDIDFDALSEAGGACADVDAYVSSLSPSRENACTGLFEGKNLILICAEAFSGSIIDPDLTPTLYRMATKGINFNDYYQQSLAGTTGGEYQLLFGLLPTSGGSSVRTITRNGTHTNIGALLNEQGYYGMAFHNSSYTYYGRDVTHNRMGYSEGFMGMGNGLESLISRRWPESDLEMIQATLPMYMDHQPFSVYYMTVSGHSGYTFGTNAMSKENKDAVNEWCEANELEYSEPVRAYIAANLELEKAMAYLLETLEEEGLADDTVICIAPDHFPYGLDSNASIGNMPYLSELYGYEVNTYEERDRNRAIIWCRSLEESDPLVVDAPTSSIDILPTLCNLFHVDWDSRLYPGRDVFSDALPIAFNGNYDWKTDLGFYSASRVGFTPADETVEIPEGYVAQVSAIVRNKMTFCRSVLSYDYYTHVYGAVMPENNDAEDPEPSAEE